MADSLFWQQFDASGAQAEVNVPVDKDSKIKRSAQGTDCIIDYVTYAKKRMRRYLSWLLSKTCTLP
jgi:hypothetical protein